MSESIGSLKRFRYTVSEVEWDVRDIPFRIRNDKFECRSPVFSFEGNTWTLQVLIETGTVRNLYLGVVKVEGNHEWQGKFKCKLGFKKNDGSVNYLLPCFSKFGADSIAVGEEQLSATNLVDLLASNGFTIVCSLQHDITGHSAQTSERTSLKLIKLDTLSENFKNLFADTDSCDVKLRVKNQEFKAHKAVLIARSTVFSSMFHHDSSENQTGIVIIPDCDPGAFQLFLQYLYSGKLEEISFQNVFHLYHISDKYNVQELRAFCVEYMTQCLTKDNICHVVLLSDLHEEAALFSAAQEFFNNNADKVVESGHWENLMKNNYRLANRLIKGMVSKRKKRKRSSTFYNLFY